MPFERRLAAALVLLLGTIPVMGAFLPAHPEGLVAPLAVLICTAATVVALRPRVAGIAASTLGSLAMVAFTGWVAEPQGLAHTALVPLALALAGAPLWGAAVGLAVAIAMTMTMVGLPTAPIPSFASLSDFIGTFALIGWLGWVIGRGVRASLARRDLDELHTMAATLEAGISRDGAQLWAVAKHLTDTGLKSWVRGQGLDEDGLNLATRLVDGTVLAARIEGDPLATLTVAYALRASAAAGVKDPEQLREIASRQLDEVNDPDDLIWIAVYDPETDTWKADPEDLIERRVRHGRLYFEDKLSRRTSRDTLIERLAVDGMPVAPPVVLAIAEAVSIALLLPASAFAAFAGPWLGSIPLVAALAAHGLMDWRQRAHRARYEETERAVDDRIDCRDDIHHGLARMLGGLLPYQVAKGATVATAHRLRGDVIGGSFADMLVDDDGKIRVLAGEVAGEGIGAGFLSIAAQMALREHVVSKDWEAAMQATDTQVRHEASVLRYPLVLELGMVEVDDDQVRGSGSLDRLVVYRPEEKKAEQVEQVELSRDACVYLSPGASRAGPEDSAPTMDRAAVGDRLVTVLSGDFEPEGAGLPSLFSEVFDGDVAPGHGTLIELSIDEEAAARAALIDSPLGEALGAIVVDATASGVEVDEPASESDEAADEDADQDADAA